MTGHTLAYAGPADLVVAAACALATTVLVITGAKGARR